MSSAAVHHSVEVLVDLFLTDDVALEESSDFVGEGCVEEIHDGEVVTEEMEAMDQEFLRVKIGRDLRDCGNEFNKQYATVTHRSLSDDIQNLFKDMVAQAGGKPEIFWPRFRDLMDNAVRDTGLDDTSKVLGAVLVSIRGLQKLGSGVRTFTLRYISERQLDRDLRAVMSKNETHPSLD